MGRCIFEGRTCLGPLIYPFTTNPISNIECGPPPWLVLEGCPPPSPFAICPNLTSINLFWADGERHTDDCGWDILINHTFLTLGQQSPLLPLAPKENPGEGATTTVLGLPVQSCSSAPFTPCLGWWNGINVAKGDVWNIFSVGMFFCWHVFLSLRNGLSKFRTLGRVLFLEAMLPLIFFVKTWPQRDFWSFPKIKKNGSSKAWFFTANKVVSKISTFNYGAWINIKKIKNGHIIHFRMHLHIF